VIASTVACAAGRDFHNPHGGFAVGPRYLAAVRAGPNGIARTETGAALTAVSVGLMAMVTAVAPAEDLMTASRLLRFRLVHGARYHPDPRPDAVGERCAARGPHATQLLETSAAIAWDPLKSNSPG
jgi:hypothetical protein